MMRLMTRLLAALCASATLFGLPALAQVAADGASPPAELRSQELGVRNFGGSPGLAYRDAQGWKSLPISEHQLPHALALICPGILKGDMEIAACLQRFVDAQTGPATIVAPPGAFTYAKSVKTRTPLHLIGSWDATSFTSAQPAGGPAGSFLDIGPGSDKSEIEHIKVDGQMTQRRFVMPANNQPLSSDLILVEANEVSVHDVTLTNSFDNCIAVSALDPKTSGSLEGRPYGYSLNHIRTSACGQGNRAGAGIDIASGQTGTVNDLVDTGSYGAFICDIGAGAQGTFSNITSSLSAHQAGQGSHAIYAGCSDSSYANIHIVAPGDNGFWADIGATNNKVTNLEIKGAGGLPLLIKSALQLVMTNVTIDGIAAPAGTVDAVLVDNSAGPVADLVVAGLNVRAGTNARYGVDFTGPGSTTGTILGFNLDGAMLPFKGTPRGFNVLGAPAMGHNLVRNATFDINQRGHVSGQTLAPLAYGLDGWQNVTKAAAYTFTTPQPAEHHASAPIGSIVTLPAGMALRQYIPHTANFGGLMTLSWKGTATGQLQYDGGKGVVAVALGASPLTADIPVGTTVAVQVDGPGTVTDVQLEAGPVPTPFERLSREERLRRCLPFFQLLPSGVGSWDSAPTRFQMPLSLRVPMVRTPTATLLARGGGVLVPGVGTYAISGLNAAGQSQIDANGGALEIDTAPSVAFRMGVLPPNVKIGLSADF